MWCDTVVRVLSVGDHELSTASTSSYLRQGVIGCVAEWLAPCETMASILGAVTSHYLFQSFDVHDSFDLRGYL
jgi:hypothetical protein